MTFLTDKLPNYAYFLYQGIRGYDTIHLSFESNQVLIHAFVTSKLDYCNSLYYGLPDFLIKKLQYVQNSAARLLTGSCK